MSQLSFLSLAKRKKLRCERFLDEMTKVVPWRDLCRLIEPHYPNSHNGRPAMPLLVMLKIHFLQQWYNLSDPAMEEAIYDRNSFQQFLGIDLISDRVPDESTILRFRHLLERHGLGKAIFEKINRLLEKRGVLVQEGTIVDATLVSAPKSTKNQSGSRDPEMGSTRKGNNYYFGMKAHAGVSGEGEPLVHSVEITSASVHDSAVFESLLHGGEKWVSGDKAYDGARLAAAMEESGVDWRVMIRAARNRPLTDREEWINRVTASVRARVEFPFQVIKHLWGHVKTRYRGLEKNACQWYVLFGLANLYRVRKKLSGSPA